MEKNAVLSQPSFYLSRKFLVALLLLMTLPDCAESQQPGGFEQCVMELVESGSDDVTIAQIREACQPDIEASESDLAAPGPDVHESALERRLAVEGATSIVPFVLTPHRPNYIIAAHNFDSYAEESFEQQFNEDVFFQDQEVKFQLSYKFSIARNLFNERGALFFAYTNRSFWQLFDDKDSRPFRETNHEPEAWLALNTDWNLFGLKNRLINLGISHQSNGQGGMLSRSWNRLYASFVFEVDDFYFGIKPWYRIPEQKSDDDNADIEDYLGHFEFQGIYKHNENSYGLFFRNNLQNDNRGAVRLDWSMPVHNKWRAYVQWFYGYGESLIDYDSKVNSLGIGVQLSDWL